MAQITFELEDSLVPIKSPNDDWLEEVKALAGNWADFPTVEELCQNLGTDIPKEPL